MRTLRHYLIAAFTLAIVAAACSSGHTTRPASSSASTTTTTNNATVTTTPRLPAGLTAEQLDAHLGVGVPAGWVAVDEGDARVWAPKDWTLEGNEECIGGGSIAGMIRIGTVPQANCTPASESPIPKEAVGLLSLSKTDTGEPSLTVHGYRIYTGDAPTLDPGFWKTYDVPQLGVRIATHGTLSLRILRTIAPSARTVALDPTYESVPNDWHAVTEHGVSLSIPLSWGVATRDVFCEGPVVASEFAFIRPNIESPRCLPRIPTAASALIGGVSLYLPPHNPYAPNRHGHALATLRPGTTTITIYAEPNDPNTLDLFVHRAGSKITHVLTLGLGRDGRVAGGVLASIRAVT
ncbi:MAG: hypothetical protein ACLPVY_18530 [Acidimicrobiia bacterium]